MERAELYLRSAASGLLGIEGLAPCSQLMQIAELDYDGTRVRGAVAATDLPASDVCIIGETAVLDVVSLRHMLELSLTDQAQLAELASIDALVLNPADERSLLATLLLREADRSSSPVMPYVKAFLEGAHADNPASWDPESAVGATRRSTLQQTAGGSRLLMMADALRKAVADFHAALVPRALEQLPALLATDSMAAGYYSVQRFTEVWLSIRSRSFDNGAYGVLLPLACLLNHPAHNGEPNVAITYDAEQRGFVLRAVRAIKRGEELTYSYGRGLCRERALLVYGFEQPGMPPCS